MIWRGIKLAFAVWLGTFICLAVFVVIWPAIEDPMPKGELIFVLGGGMEPDGTLRRSSVVRVDRAVALYQSEAAPRVLFSGGRTEEISAAESMAVRAISMGIPKTVIIREEESQSTLQNALFSVPYTKGVERIVLVTEAFHLPRSWVSTKLFGAGKVTLIHAPDPNENFGRIALNLARESLAFWFNAARFVVWWATGSRHHQLLY